MAYSACGVWNFFALLFSVDVNEKNNTADDMVRWVIHFHFILIGLFEWIFSQTEPTRQLTIQCIHQGTNFSASFRQILFLWYFLKRKMCSFLDQTIVLNKFWQKLLVFDSLSTNTQLKYPVLFPAETCGEVGSLLYTHARQQTLTITCAHTCMTYDKFRSTRRTTKNQLSKWNSPYLSQSIFAFNRMPFKDMVYTNAMGVVRSL